MKTIKQLAIFFLFFCSAFSLNAQSYVEAGNNKAIICEGSVQLNAEPILDGVWDSIHTGMSDSFNAICFRNSNTGFVATTTGAIYKTTDGGTTWVSKPSGTTNGILTIRFYDDNIGYAVGNNGTIIKTTNGGESWITLNSGVTSTLNSLFAINENTIVVVGAAGTVLKSSDGGQTWILKKLSSNLYDVAFPSFNTGYICGSIGTLYQTKDGGNTWVKQFTQVTNSLNSISFASDSIGCAIGTGNMILSINGVSNIHQTITPVPPSSAVNTVCLTSKDNGYITGYDGSIKIAYVFKTNDGGQNWSQVAFFASKKSMSGSFVGLNTGYICGPGGFIAKLKVEIPANDTYKWTPDTGLSNPNIINPIASPTVATKYVVTRNNNGYISTDSVFVDVVPLEVYAGSDKNIGCEGSVQLDRVNTNYNGKGKLRYKWTPSEGLNCDTIPNPIASVVNSTTYSITVSTPNGCSATGNVTVKIVPLSINAGADKTFSCGGNMQLSTSTNYSGTGRLSYKWTPASGLNSDTIANPVSSPTTTTTYTVTVKSSSGCTATDVVVVNINPLTVNVGADVSAVCGSSVQLGVTSTNYSGTGTLKYKWIPSTGLNNDTIANPVALAANVAYTLTITAPSGCSASDIVNVSVIPMSAPAINYVGINEKNKNVLYWTKPGLGKISSFNIYKETNVTNSYAKIGSLPFDSASVFIDTNSNPDVQSNKYKLSVTDACGNETPLSIYHKTMHLSINKGINNVWNLIWEAYEGYSVSTYNIYRGTRPDNIQIIGSLSGSNTQFSDYTAPSGTVYYQVEAVSSTMAGVKPQSISGVKSTSQLTYSSRSNIATNGLSGIDELQDISNQITISPNPASDRIKLSIISDSFEPMKVNIYNVLGSLIKSVNVSRNITEIATDELKSGIYMVEIKSGKSSGMKKLIIEK